MADNPFEQRVIATNVGYFLREFSISKTRYTPPGHTEIEFADQVILIGPTLFLIQMKNRDAPSADAKKEREWYRKNVWSKAVQQLRDTLTQIRAVPPFSNDQGDTTQIPQSLEGLRVFKIVVYNNVGSALPTDSRATKHRPDEEAGFVHIFHVDDYELMLQTLVTLAEVTEYLTYREQVLKQHSGAPGVPEAALLGGFIRYNAPIEPKAEHAEFLASLIDERESFDIGGILDAYRSKIYNHSQSGPPTTLRTSSPAPYYPILEELIQLPRTALKIVKDRYRWALAKCSGDGVRPALLAFGDVGFAFIPVPAGVSPEQAANGLQSYTTLAKHHLKVDRMLGISFRRDGRDFLIDWALVVAPWQENAELDAIIEETKPFRDMRADEQKRYRFDS